MRRLPPTQHVLLPRAEASSSAESGSDGAAELSSLASPNDSDEEDQHDRAAQAMLHKMRQQLPSSSKKPPPAAEDANDVVYKALMDHKRAEMQRMTALASDTRTITEAMLRKQVFPLWLCLLVG